MCIGHVFPADQLLRSVAISSFLFFVFKQKTAYEMRISDWSSDVCSSDLVAVLPLPAEARGLRQRLFHHRGGIDEDLERAGMLLHQPAGEGLQPLLEDRKSVV